MCRFIHIFFLFFLSTEVQAERCPEMQSFKKFASGEIEEDTYHVGYTSGYRQDNQGAYYFRRCVKNLHKSAWVNFRWQGPRPTPIFSGKLPKGRAMVEEWKRSLKAEERDVRDLGLSLNDNFEEFGVDTYFEKASVSETPLVLAQANENELVFIEGSAREFFTDLEQRVRQPGTPDGPNAFRMNTGVMASIPVNPETWGTYLEPRDVDAAPQSLGEFAVVITAKYDFDTKDIVLEVAAGANLEKDGDQFQDALLSGLEVGFTGLSGLGFEAVEMVSLNSDDELFGIPGGFAQMRRREIPIGSFEAAFDDSTFGGVGTQDIPVEIRLNEIVVYQLHLEVFALLGPI